LPPWQLPFYLLNCGQRHAALKPLNDSNAFGQAPSFSHRSRMTCAVATSLATCRAPKASARPQTEAWAAAVARAPRQLQPTPTVAPCGSQPSDYGRSADPAAFRVETSEVPCLRALHESWAKIRGAARRGPHACLAHGSLRFLDCLARVSSVRYARLNEALPRRNLCFGPSISVA